MVTLSVAGTGTNITYLWSNGATTPTIQINAAGSYTATVSGTCGSVGFNVAQVNPVGLPSITGISPGTIVAPGFETVNLSVTATGSNLQYLWSNGSTTRTITGVGAGEYFVTVTGTCGFVVSEGVRVGNVVLLTGNSGYRPITTFGSIGSANNQFGLPSDIAVPPDGRIFIADAFNHRISVWTQSGNNFSNIATFGSNGFANNQLSFPSGVTVAPDEKIFIADSDNT